MRLVIAAALLLLPSLAFAQDAKAKPAPSTSKFAAVAPLTVKAGEHIVVDAGSAAGDVFFFYDETVFPKARATHHGKVLVLSTNVPGTYSVYVVSLEDKAKEKFEIKVTGAGPLPPDPPLPPSPGDPIVELRAEMARNFAAMDARLKALEKVKPNPPDRKLTSVTFLIIGIPPETDVVTQDVSIKKLLKDNGVGLYAIVTKEQQDANPKFRGIPNKSIVMQDQDNNVITYAPIVSVEAAVAFVNLGLGR